MLADVTDRFKYVCLFRPGEYQSTLSIAWEALLHETQADAQVCELER